MIALNSEIFHTRTLEESGDLVDISYQGLVSIMKLMDVNKKRDSIIFMNLGYKYSEKDYGPFMALAHGVYYPGIDRAYLVNDIDVRSDELVEEGCLNLPSTGDPNELFRWVYVKKRGGLDRKKWIVPAVVKDPLAFYTSDMTIICDGNDRRMHRMANRSAFAVMQDGKVVPCHSREALRDESKSFRASLQTNNKYMGYHWGPAAVNLLNDSKHLWLVEVGEPIYDNMNAVLRFGVDSEWVKSLLFAREAPLTESGRKRPILHWVREHKRRLKNKEDIDISKHLRGITEVSMSELNFKITQPVKENGK
jgi:hypothetical protein